MKKLLLLLFVLCCCDEPAVKKPAYILLGQSNACSELALNMQKNTYIRVLQINHGGQPIETWYTEDQQIHAIEDLTYIDNSEYYIVAVFWFQGESNCYNANTQENYYQYTANWFDRLKQEYGNIDINIFQIYYPWGNEEILSNVDFIRSEQQRLHEDYTGFIIDTQGYDRINESWHLTSSEYARLGADVISIYE